MQDNFNTYLLIDDYLNGNLSKQESTAFEKELKENSELQELVNDYKLVDSVIEQHEFVAINSKLSTIHSKSILRKNILKAFIGLTIIAGLISVFLLIPTNKVEEIDEKVEVATKTTKALAIITEPTPFKIVDSMTEVELSSSIKASKENTIINSEIIPKIDSIIEEIPLAKVAETPTPNPSKKVDSILPKKANPTQPILPKETQEETQVATVKTPCTLSLTLESIELTNTCKEKRTGVILFANTNANYSYSIDDKESYSKKSYFNYLEGGTYFVAIKNETCESKSIEVTIESFQCNFAIEPARFIYFEKDLAKFEGENTVEILIFNRNGNIVFNQTTPVNIKFIWDGKSNTNFPTPMGNYTYIIKSGKKISKGEITIIR